MADPGEPPPYFRPNWGPKGPKKKFWRQPPPPPPLSQSLGDRVPILPPLSQGLGPVLNSPWSRLLIPHFLFFLLNFRWNRRSPSNMGYSGSRTFSLPYSFVPPWLSRNLGLFRRDQLFESGQCTRLDWISSKRKVLANEKTFDCSCGKQSGWNQ